MANTSYGLIEVSGVVAAVDSLDAMCKASNVSLVTWERKLGGRLVTVIVEGTVSDVKSAVEAAIAICNTNNHIMAANGIIAAPSDEIRKMVKFSAKRLERLAEKEKLSEPKESKTAVKEEPKKEEVKKESKKKDSSIKKVETKEKK